MTDNLLQKLEEKIMALLTEMETMRQELGQVKQENSILRNDKSQSIKKVEELISLLDALDVPDISSQLSEQEIFQGQEEYALAE